MKSSINTVMSAPVWGMLILLSMLWGGSFFFVGIAVEALPPLSIVTLRVGVAAITLWCIALLLGQRIPRRLNVWAALLGIGLLNNVIPFTLIVWGQTHIASGLASILNASTPIFAVIIAGLLLPDERLTRLKLTGVIIGFIGVVVMIGLPVLNGTGSLLPQLAIIGAALCYAFAGALGRRFTGMGLSPMITAAGQVTASTLVLLPITLIVDGPLQIATINAATILSILGLAVLSTALAYVLYFKILELAGATNVLLVTLLVPVSAILLGFLFLGESLAMIHFLGMGLIAIGLSAIDGRIWKRK